MADAGRRPGVDDARTSATRAPAPGTGPRGRSTRGDAGDRMGTGARAERSRGPEPGEWDPERAHLPWSAPGGGPGPGAARPAGRRLGRLRPGGGADHARAPSPQGGRDVDDAGSGGVDSGPGLRGVADPPPRGGGLQRAVRPVPARNPGCHGPLRGLRCPQAAGIGPGPRPTRGPEPACVVPRPDRARARPLHQLPKSFRRESRKLETRGPWSVPREARSNSSSSSRCRGVSRVGTSTTIR